MSIQLPSLPYALDALEPYISRRTLEFHYGKHHKKYVETLNELIAGTAYDKMTLQEIVFESAHKEGKDKKIFNNAAQAWNHSFFWSCLSPNTDSQPSEGFVKKLARHFGSEEKFLALFKKTAAELFGSGWAWLVKDEDGALSIMPLENAGNPMAEGRIPLFTCDVWEHAYYLDYQNDRAKYLDRFCEIINWKFIELNFEKGHIFIHRPASVAPARQSVSLFQDQLHH